MAGFKNRLITIEFPDLTEDGEQMLYVTIRNPQLVPLDWMLTRLATDANGAPLDADASLWESYERIAKLITSMRMYDAAADSDDPPLLELPATPEQVSRFPKLVTNRIAEEMNAANVSPTTTPDSPTS